MRLILLPPQAPELNPVKHLRDELREKYFCNLVFNSFDAREHHLEKALRTMELDHKKNQIHRRLAMDCEFMFDLELELELVCK